MKLISKLCLYHICLIWGLITSANLYSQNVVKQISNLNGLSNNSVNCILEDSEHNLWIGTWDGLNMYNGRDCKSFRYDKDDIHSINSNIVWQIIEQNDTYLWVATDFGLNRLDRKKLNFERIHTGKDKQFIGITSDKRLIVYDLVLGLLYYDEEERKLKTLHKSLTHNVSKMVVDSYNNVYLMTEHNKVFKISLNSNNNNLSVKDIDELPQVIVNIFFIEEKLITDHKGYIEITDYRSKKKKKINTDQGKAVSQLAYNKGDLFIAFNGIGCKKYNPNSGYFEDIEGISENLPVFSLYSGSQNILWIGSDGQGIFSIYEYRSPFNTAKTNHPVRSFSKTDNDVFLVGTKGDGIKSLERKTGEINDLYGESNGLISNSVYVMKKNTLGDIFIGTEGAGINILRNKSNKLDELILPANVPEFKSVYSLTFTHNDSILWLGTSGYGLIKIKLYKNDDTYVVTDVKRFQASDREGDLNNNKIFSIIKGRSDNEIWLGTRGGGVNIFDINTEKFIRLDDISPNLSLSNNDILSLMKDENGDVWVGTGYGLNHLQLSKNPLSIVEYTDDKAFMNNTIHGILRDKNQNIWVSTNYGISNIIPHANEIISYTSKDGLHNDEFADGAYYSDSEYTLFFGGVNGLSYFIPDRIQLRDYIPNISLSNLKINNNNLEIYDRIKSNTLKLSYGEPYVTFTFAAHDFINNENCEFKYRVVNFSDEWIDNGSNPSIAITKLPPGNYQLEVKCSNGDRVWNDNVYTLNLNVAYPWWLSIPAFIVYAILTIIIIYIVRSVIVNRIRLNRRLLLEHIEKEHQQKIHESKLNFFTNVAHEFFTPLTLIYGPAEHLLEKTELDDYSKRYIQIIKNNADRMNKLINELMEFRKAESGHTSLHAEQVDLGQLMEYIVDNYSEIREENKIDFKIETENISKFVTDRLSLEKILFNLISNAFKYTPTGGYIYIYMSQNINNGEEINIRIRNSGRGLTEKQISEMFSRFKIFETTKQTNASSTGIGLNLTKSLVELLGGSMKVNSVLTEYVEFSVMLYAMEEKENLESAEDEIVVNREALTDRHKEISVLIVEDERNIRELLKDILDPYYNTIEAANGEEGLKAIDMNMPDIIISDILMPKLDGIGFIDKLRSNERTAHLPIISISAKNAVEDHINAYSHGADLYITKPFHPHHVLSAIENIIKKYSLLKKYFDSSWSAMTVKDGITIHHEDENLLNEIVKYIENNIDDESLSPNSISDFIGISKASLYRKLKELTDKTPSEFVRTIRLDYATKLLKTTKLTVAEIMYKSGFSNKSYFYREFLKLYNLSPKEYRDKMS